MPTSDIGIDLGTRNSLAYSTGKGLVLNEPSIVVYDKNTEKIRAIGEEARAFHHDVDAVRDSALDKSLHHIIWIMLIAQNILTP